jgi:ribonuclease R
LSKSSRLPTKQQVLDFLRDSPDRVGKREIARAFGVRGADRAALNAILQELRAEGLLASRRRAKDGAPRRLPQVCVVTVSGLDADGEVLARPVGWPGDEKAPTIYMAPDRRGAIGVGERALVRLNKTAPGTYEASIIRRLGGEVREVLGVYRRGPEGGRLVPTDRRHRRDYVVADAAGARPGELVVGEVQPPDQRGFFRARVIERVGDADDPRAFSQVAIHQHGLPTRFPEAALAEAEAAGPVGPESFAQGREDLRAVPLVTIDGADARDFDDAVWAEPAADGGWSLIVAIADVSWYVRPDGDLDRNAYARGNSAYFPDRVVPMLPERLSNDLCSLRPGQDRACVAAHLSIDTEGQLRKWRFARALMRSAARLTYDQVQDARDGEPDARTAALQDSVIAPLYGAFAALERDRAKRAPLGLDLPERVVRLDPDGSVRAVDLTPRRDSHRLIEAFMITANVAAARALDAAGTACMYRVHAAPDPAKVAALQPLLEGMGYRLAKGQVLRPRHFNAVLQHAAGTEDAALVSDVVLRCQARAEYSPDNIGHFGLALRHYAHFTSPIRRYADLLVHRALVQALRLGAGGLPEVPHDRFADMAQHISDCERRADAAERDATDRYVAAYHADRVGEAFTASISGVTRFGLFLRLADSAAEGLVPIRTLPEDYYDHDAVQHCLVGRDHGRVYRLGETVEARLVAADPLAGGLQFELLGDPGPQGPPRGRVKQRPQSRPKRGPAKRPQSRGPPAGSGRRGRRRG